MKLKKGLGCLILLLATALTNVGNASLAFVGTEDMPESMKNTR